MLANFYCRVRSGILRTETMEGVCHAWNRQHYDNALPLVL